MLKETVPLAAGASCGLPAFYAPAPKAARVICDAEAVRESKRGEPVRIERKVAYVRRGLCGAMLLKEQDGACRAVVVWKEGGCAELGQSLTA